MNQELKDKILSYNITKAVDKEKATDLDIIVGEIMKLPYGQLKNVLTNKIMAVLEKYGYTN